MSRKITTEVFTFDELNDEAKKVAIENNRNFNTESDFWDEAVLEYCKEKLSDYGFGEVEIHYTGFCSQGDGACFVATLDNGGMLNFLKKEKTLSKYPKLVKAINDCEIYVNIQITHGDRYYHSYSTTVDNLTEMQDNSELPPELEKEYMEWYESFFDTDSRNVRTGWYIDECDSIYKALGKTYDYLQTDEVVSEAMEENGFEFTSDGKRF